MKENSTELRNGVRRDDQRESGRALGASPAPFSGFILVFHDLHLSQQHWINDRMGERGLIDWKPEAFGRFGVRMEGAASGEPQRTRYHSLAGLRGLDSPPLPQLLPLYMHSVMHTAMRSQTHGMQEHPFVNVCTQKCTHTFTQAHIHAWILLKKHIRRHAHSLAHTCS